MTTESRPTRFPVGVVIAAAIALTFMIIWSAVHVFVVGLAAIAGATASPGLGLAIGGGGAVVITAILLVASLVRANRLHVSGRRHP